MMENLAQNAKKGPHQFGLGDYESFITGIMRLSLDGVMNINVSVIVLSSRALVMKDFFSPFHV